MDVNHMIWLATALCGLVISASGVHKKIYIDILLGLLFFFYAISHVVLNEEPFRHWAPLFLSVCILCTGIYKALRMARKSEQV